MFWFIKKIAPLTGAIRYYYLFTGKSYKAEATFLAQK